MQRTSAPLSRLLAIDWLRGLVMILMTVDHASDAFNAGRLMTDGVGFAPPGTALPAAQFFTRWVTHLCAPTFVFLAGTALALSSEKQRRLGKSDAEIDRFTFTRGLFIALLDPLWMVWAFGEGAVILQVMYAIGTSFMIMPLVRRLPQRWLVASGFGLLVLSEALGRLALSLGGGPTVPGALLLTGGMFSGFMIAYPTLPWLSVMILGFAMGRRIIQGAPLSERQIAALSFGALAVFLGLRALKGYGNMRLQPESDSLIQWLRTSKYPPSVTYLALEFSLMGLFFLLFSRLSRLPGAPDSAWGKLLTLLGQTALFYYVLHMHLLEFTARALGVKSHFGLGVTFLSAVVTLAILLPLCALYRRYKGAHPDGWTRYL